MGERGEEEEDDDDEEDEDEAGGGAAGLIQKQCTRRSGVRWTTDRPGIWEEGEVKGDSDCRGLVRRGFLVFNNTGAMIMWDHQLAL